MKRYMHFFCSLLLLHLSACGQKVSENKSDQEVENNTDTAVVDVITIDSSIVDSLGTGLNFSNQGNYNTRLSEVDVLKSNCRKLLEQYSENKDSIIAEIGKRFESYLLNKIVPHWYGTPWEFSGYTNVPNQGAIACGYFVSTTLKHMKMPLNRYKLAQQGAYDEGRSLAIDQSQMEIIPFDTIFDYARQMKDGLYFLGLDYHVGYLWIHKKEPYFLHSNYVENKVMLEKAQYSPAFLSSTNYYIVPITHNQPLMESWLNNTAIKIYLTP